MPEWFKMLGMITLASIMVLFLMGIVTFIIALVVVSYREWQQGRECRKE